LARLVAQKSSSDENISIVGTVNFGINARLNGADVIVEILVLRLFSRQIVQDEPRSRRMMACSSWLPNPQGPPQLPHPPNYWRVI